MYFRLLISRYIVYLDRVSINGILNKKHFLKGCVNGCEGYQCDIDINTQFICQNKKYILT